MKRIWRAIKDIWYGFFYSMKITEEDVLKPKGVSENVGTEITQQQHSNRLSTALLAGKETQQVRELRYRTYVIDREAKKYKYYSPTLAIKRDEKQDSKFVTYENSDEHEVITIQPNFPIVEGVEQGLEQVGKRGKKTEYWITIGRKFGFVPRYFIEPYVKRVVVKKRNDEDGVVIDLYVSKYPDDKDFKSKGFVKEIERIKDDGIRSDVIDIDTLCFGTLHAYKVPDMMFYKFSKFFYKTVVEFDGHYVIRFNAHADINGIDLTDEFYCKEMDEKYKNNEKKEFEIDLMGEKPDEVYVCADCGKEVIYSTKAMNEMEVTSPDGEKSDVDNTEFLDMQIAEQTFGRKLCRDCMQKQLAEIDRILEK